MRKHLKPRRLVPSSMYRYIACHVLLDDLIKEANPNLRCGRENRYCVLQGRHRYLSGNRNRCSMEHLPSLWSHQSGTEQITGSFIDHDLTFTDDVVPQ